MDADYSLEALTRFLDHAAEKGLMKRETAMGRKRAAEKILSALESSETGDLRKIDLDEAARRFANRQGSDYKPDSLRVYESRLKSAVSEFVNYANDPARYKPSLQQRNRPRTTPESTSGGSRKQAGSTSKKPVANAHKESTTTTGNHEVDALTVPVPVRAGVMVHLQGIPSDLTVAEAEKIANVVKAYAMIEN